MYFESLRRRLLMNETAYRIGHIFNFHIEVRFNKWLHFNGRFLTYQIKEINRESANLVARHNNAFPGELCHLQKHSLQAVPVNEILNKVRVPIDKYRTVLRRERYVRH